MIREFNLNDYSTIYKLGKELHKDYAKLVNLAQIASDDFSHIYVYELDGEIVAFLHLTKLYETIDIVDIIVEKKYRRQGIASIMLDYVISEFDDVILMTLEVNENNDAAINFYKKFGFEVVSLRKNYYGTENAYLMKRGI